VLKERRQVPEFVILKMACLWCPSRRWGYWPHS